MKREKQRRRPAYEPAEEPLGALRIPKSLGVRILEIANAEIRSQTSVAQLLMNLGLAYWQKHKTLIPGKE